MSSVQGISALLTAYNPSPIYQYCSFWVMLCNPGSNKYAQVGWVKWTGMQNEYVWAEFTDDNGTYYQFFYNKQLNTWVWNQPSTIPASIEGYFVTYTAGTPGTISMQYDNSPLLTYHGNWVPNHLQVYGETHNYGAANAGDHMPGDTANKVSASQIMKRVNGSWSWASLTMYQQGWGTYETNANHGFNIWDTRNCN